MDLRSEKEATEKRRVENNSPAGTEVADDPQRSLVTDVEGCLDTKGFFRQPTAEEVSYLALLQLCDLGTYSQQARNQFAHLLNRGSSLE